MLTNRAAYYLILGIVGTIPIIFGAVHPVILGLYVFIMLVGCGGWLLLTLKLEENVVPSFWIAVPLILIGYLIFQSIPLPLDVVELLSPMRAERIKMVNELAGTNHYWTTLSDSGITGLYRSFFFFGLLLYYCSLRRILSGDDQFLSKLILILVVVGIFEALYGILQFVKPQLGILWLTIKSRAAHGTIIYKNQYASMLNMLWPIAITGGVISRINKKKKSRSHTSKNKLQSTTVEVFTTIKLQSPIFLFGAVVMILAVLFSLSRGGILSMILIGLLLIIMFPLSLKYKLLFLGVFSTVVFGYVVLLGLDTLVNRFGSLGASGFGRLDIYLGSIPMLLDNWLTGVGLESYNLLSPVYLKGFPENIHFDRVHNEYLEIMIELGIPFGTLLLCWIVGGMINLFIRLSGAMKYNKSDDTLIAVGVAVFCGLIGFLVHGIVDFGWRLPVNLLYAITLLAILSACLKSQAVNSSQSKI